MADQAGNGLLVRVGIDSTYGNWNSPVRAESGEFAYVPIPEGNHPKSGLERLYDEFEPATQRLNCELPACLIGKTAHVDPDFGWLTFGDQGQRGQRISTLGPGDLLAFYAGLRAVDRPDRSLVYALIGLFVIAEIVPAISIPPDRWAENAHTRRPPCAGDVIVRARPEVSGRLRQCIPIGEYRDRAYRVRKDLLKTWGDLDIKDGYIHRSVRLPAFRDAQRFYEWFLDQKPELIPANNPDI